MRVYVNGRCYVADNLVLSNITMRGRDAHKSIMAHGILSVLTNTNVKNQIEIECMPN